MYIKSYRFINCMALMVYAILVCVKTVLVHVLKKKGGEGGCYDWHKESRSNQVARFL